MLRGACAAGSCLLAALASLSAAQTHPGDAASMIREHQAQAFVSTPAPCLTPEGLGDEIARLQAAHPERLTVERVGKSFLGRDIRMISIGRGDRSILLWSQMHGDEPTATPALLDLADYLSRHASEPEVERILAAFTLRMIPMLNPDGAAQYERRNAQGIDINRDALMLTTPEGRLLKSIRERFAPFLGFNLHDQGRRVTVGGTGVLSSISLLAVAGDEAGTLTPGRERAKRVASRIVKALTPFIPGGIARYDEDWNPRAFGDNVTAWGTPVVLIESGGFPPGGGFKDLTRLNFAALASILDGLAANDLAGVSPDAYDGLLRNRGEAYADVAVTGVEILEPQSGQWFTADIAFDALASDQTIAGCPVPPRRGSRVVEVGDSRLVTPGRTIEGRGMLIAPFEDLDLPPGPVSAESLLALRPGVTVGSNPKDLLRALRLSTRGLSRNGRASFVIWMPGDDPGGSGRYLSVVEGVGLETLGDRP